MTVTPTLSYLYSLFSIYIDAVVNHMTGHGASGTGTGGSSFNGNNEDYPGTVCPVYPDRSTKLPRCVTAFFWTGYIEHSVIRVFGTGL